jgi:pimeloyl-ACP methyl ester carboxylesterase
MGVFGGAVLFLTGPQVVFKEHVVPSLSGNPIRTRYVFPAFEKAPKERSHPAVVAIPPYNIPPEAMEIICVELARRGIVCAIPDFFGKTRAESRQNMEDDSLSIMTSDVLSIAESLKALPWVDPGRLGTCGHSVGGTVAFLAGLSDPTIKAVVPIGMQTEVHPRRPQNLLLLAGLYDEIHTPTALLKTFEEYRVAANPAINTLYGNFDQGTARQITIIPTCDHFIEMFDPLLIRQLLSWYALAFDMPDLGQGALREWWRRVMAFIFMFSATVVYTILMNRLFSNISSGIAAKLPLWLTIRIPVIPLLMILVALWLSGSAIGGFRTIAADLMMSVLLAHSVICFRVKQELECGKQPSYRSLRSTSCVVLALGIAMLFTWFIMSLPYYFRFPSIMFWYPVFVINTSVLFPLQIWSRMVSWLFADMINGLQPNRLYITLLCFILIFPDWLMRLFNRIAEEITASFKPKPGALTLSDRSPLKIALLVVLLGIFAFLVYRRIVEGMLTPETTMKAALILLRFAILPFPLTWLIIRTRLFRRISKLD